MSRIEKASHISVIVVSVAAFVCLIPTLRSSLFPSNYRLATAGMVGQKLELPGAQLSHVGATVLIALSSRCRFCIASLPFYKELSSIAGGSEGRVSLLVASTTSNLEEVTALLQEYHVQPARILPSSFRSLHISGTPTVYVLDGSGTIQWAHAGRMDDARQKELVRLLKDGFEKAVPAF